MTPLRADDAAWSLLTRQLTLTGRAAYRARGHSMAPAVRDGSLVTLEPAHPDGLRPGAIALACCGGQWVLHRVVRRHAGGWLLRGDASRREDVVRTEEIAAIAARIEPPPAAARAPRFAPLRRRLARWLRRLQRRR
jgi:hypothetical protein